MLLAIQGSEDLCAMMYFVSRLEQAPILVPPLLAVAARTLPHLPRCTSSHGVAEPRRARQPGSWSESQAVVVLPLRLVTFSLWATASLRMRAPKKPSHAVHAATGAERAGALVGCYREPVHSPTKLSCSGAVLQIRALVKLLRKLVRKLVHVQIKMTRASSSDGLCSGLQSATCSVRSCWDSRRSSRSCCTSGRCCLQP